MPIVAVPIAGQFGISLDIAPAELPGNAWSSGYNVRFYDGALGSMNGDIKIADLPAAQPSYALPVGVTNVEAAKWLVMADAKAYALTGIVFTDITPVGAVAPSYPPGALVWSGGSLGTLTIVHDTVRTPWIWMQPESVVPMVELANWPIGMTAYTLRSFKQYLVALDVTKSGTRYPTMVKWSHPADPGAVPPSWDETDPTKDAGETVLAETPGSCVDAVSLRDSLVIYKTDSVWGMSYIGGVFIFRFFKIFGDWGVPNRNCAVEYIAGKHFCFTGTDLIIHDGNSAASIIKGRMKALLRSITADQLPTCYVCAHPAYSEVWFCWRRKMDGVLAADTAMVFNTVENTLSLRILPDLRFIGTGRVDPIAVGGDTWNAQITTWDTAGVVWAESAQIPAFLRLLGLGTHLVSWVDGADTMHGPLMVERTYVGIPMRSNLPPDLSTVKFIRRVWPRFTGAVGTKLKVTFGSADSVGEEIKWRKALTFIIGTTRKFDITLSGKVMALRIEADTPGNPAAHSRNVEEETLPSPFVEAGTPTSRWRFTGMDIDLVPSGEM